MLKATFKVPIITFFDVYDLEQISLAHNFVLAKILYILYIIIYYYYTLYYIVFSGKFFFHIKPLQMCLIVFTKKLIQGFSDWVLSYFFPKNIPKKVLRIEHKGFVSTIRELT